MYFVVEEILAKIHRRRRFIYWPNGCCKRHNTIILSMYRKYDFVILFLQPIVDDKYHLKRVCRKILPGRLHICRRFILPPTSMRLSWDPMVPVIMCDHHLVWFCRVVATGTVVAIIVSA
jgi:hypothetical protein